MSIKKKKYIVVPHTHWDREWYLTFEELRMRLVKMMDSLLDIFEKDREAVYTLDGQTVMLEDYLKIRPENKGQFRKLIQEKRVFVGPWYSQCDTRLINGECIIRNLLMGHKLAEDYGAVHKIGYLPDNFGNIGQLPQILLSFGIDNFIGSRGVDCPSNEFQWVGDDGSKILGVFQRFGYPTYDLDRFLENNKNAREKIRANIDRLIEYELSGTILLSAGGDFREPEPGFNNYVKYAAEHEKLDIKTGSYLDYVRAIRRYMGNFPVIRGELNTPASRYVHASGVLSARMPVKAANKKTENQLIYQTEPIASLAYVFGAEYPQPHLDIAWKQLMQNHAHDSIYGCSIDPVFKDVFYRYAKSKQISTLVLNKSMEFIGTQVNKLGHEISRVVVFNTLPFNRSAIVKVQLNIPHSIQNNIRLISVNQSQIPVYIEEVCQAKRGKLESTLTAQKTRALNIYFSAKDIPAMGYQAFYVVRDDKVKKLSIKKGRGKLNFENPYIKVVFNKNGSINLFDKSKKILYKNLNYFEDSGDSGDLFTYSPPLREMIISSLKAKAKWEVILKNQILYKVKARLSLRVPKRLAKNKTSRLKEFVNEDITVVYTMYTGSARIDIETTINNQADDHRIRALFPLGQRVEKAVAAAQFFLAQRTTRKEQNWKHLWDKPQGLHPVTHFVQAGKGGRGLTIAVGGVSQYEVTPEINSKIALTLLRSVGVFRGGKEVLTRRFSWGHPIPTPDAQCHGRHVYKYTIIPAYSAKARQEAISATVPLVLGEYSYVQGNLPSSLSLFHLGNPEIRISALKKCVRNNNTILRIVDPTSKNIATYIKFSKRPKRIWSVNMAEKRIKDIGDLSNNGKLNLKFRYGEIKTFEIKWR